VNSDKSTRHSVENGQKNMDSIWEIIFLFLFSVLRWYVVWRHVGYPFVCFSRLVCSGSKPTFRGSADCIPNHKTKQDMSAIRGRVSVVFLRRCATSRKVAGSIPHEVTGFFNWPNHSSRIMAPGSTQPLIGMSTDMPCFIALRRYCVFCKLKVCGNPASSKSIGAIFPTACAHFVSLCHILVILAIFQTF
jgi:hypothetical protein